MLETSMTGFIHEFPNNFNFLLVLKYNAESKTNTRYITTDLRQANEKDCNKSNGSTGESEIVKLRLLRTVLTCNLFIILLLLLFDLSICCPALTGSTKSEYCVTCPTHAAETINRYICVCVHKSNYFSANHIFLGPFQKI